MFKRPEIIGTPHWCPTTKGHFRLALMFTVALDLSEAQRERLTSSHSLQEVEVTAYTFEAATTVFVELFCTPRSSMDNLSLRVNGHDGSTNRTLIVEDYAEDEFGQWAIDEVTGEQGYIDDERSFFGHGKTRVCLAVQTILGPPSKEKKRKRQRWIQTNRKSNPKWRTNTGSWIAVRKSWCLVVQLKKRQVRFFEGYKETVRTKQSEVQAVNSHKRQKQGP